MIISARDLQQILKEKDFYPGPIDGIEGPNTRKAIKNFVLSKNNIVENRVLRSASARVKRIAAEQLILAQVKFYDAKIDGLIGPAYRYAGEQWQNRTRTLDEPHRRTPNKWPTKSQMHSFYGAPGTNHTMLDLPFPMRLAWNKSQTVTRTTVNEKCSESLERILKEILNVYGYEEIQRLGIDLFAGIYNNRKMRGGSSLSTHAYAAAIDLDSERNRFRWGSDRAQFARPEYKPMIDAFEREEWISLGVERNMDFMHFQAVQL